ncbi:S24 family peptidase [Neptunomonas qingdaonensis]|uniref:Phage repressor protein C, contains Cro/C1-type HTH and peptisase s24 domains n=1 Tax=Neptunomonas qingdaonensis TaxID=1045558 RepID=A0A1I2N4E3_9GAMM|nr:helix-turn-helix transcriptional regulator [Neptunomonas qingdaonensis]SFF97970.1 Phage repressor protein C, contains Cro/C1-type HTH and peptisase s24 domains [Neptunomonas qingdaonensis]
MSEIRDRIIQKMHQHRLKQVDIYKRMGISRGTISQWVNGFNTPTGDNLVKLASLLRCEPKWLAFGGDENPAHPRLESGIVDSDYIKLSQLIEFERVPGTGVTDVIQSEENKLLFTKAALDSQGVNEDSVVYCFVLGDAMEPRLPDGSTVAIDTSKTAITDGKLYAVDYSGMLRVKQLYRIPGGIRARSTNGDYDDEVITGETLNDFRVIGKVFWSACFHN